jgi:hypothetical protein
MCDQSKASFSSILRRNLALSLSTNPVSRPP